VAGSSARVSVNRRPSAKKRSGVPCGHSTSQVTPTTAASYKYIELVDKGRHGPVQTKMVEKKRRLNHRALDDVAKNQNIRMAESSSSGWEREARKRLASGH